MILLNVLGVLGVLNVLHVPHVLHVLNMPMDASLACWALFFHSLRLVVARCVVVWRFRVRGRAVAGL